MILQFWNRTGRTTRLQRMRLISGKMYFQEHTNHEMTHSAVPDRCLMPKTGGEEVLRGDAAGISSPTGLADLQNNTPPQ